MGLLRSVRGLWASEGSFSDCSWLSAVSPGSWRSVHRASTSPTLQAVNRASLRPYSHDSSTSSKRDTEGYKWVFWWFFFFSRCSTLWKKRKTHLLTFQLFLAWCFPFPLLWLRLLRTVSCCSSLWRLLFLIVCFRVTQFCHTWTWHCRKLAEPMGDKCAFLGFRWCSCSQLRNDTLGQTYLQFAFCPPPSFSSSSSSCAGRDRFQTPWGPEFRMSSPPSPAGSPHLLRYLSCHGFLLQMPKNK